MSKREIKRLGELAVRLVADQAVPGVRDLFQALTEERARRFVRELNEAVDGNRITAENKIRALASSPSGEKVLMHIARECFLGTERVSLAAMAVLVSEYASVDADYREIAARSIEGLADIDAVTFLVLLSRPKTVRPIPSRWRPAHMVDTKEIDAPEWDAARKLVGINQEVVFGAITECVRRRILLPDSASGRIGGDDHLAVRYFCLSRSTMSFYRTLHRAMEIVDAPMARELALFTPEIARQSWWPAGIEEALAAAQRTG